MQGVKRKVVYVSLYEGIAIVVATLGLAGMSGQDVHTAGGVAVAASVIAILWNLAFNTMFEVGRNDRTSTGCDHYGTR